MGATRSIRSPAAWSRAALCLALITATLHALATDHALLVGVSDYPQLPRRLWLRAPGNDVALVRDTLLARGFEPARIRQLVSRAGGAAEPTRRNIVDAMYGLQADVQPGDRVVLYLAGHGSQQPQPAEHPGRHGRPAEPDGLDEVFLPADVARWDGSTAQASIPNALLDDEIGEWIDALVDRGAVVWALFDTCHAAGMARGRSERIRSISAAELGLTSARAGPVLRAHESASPAVGRAGEQTGAQKGGQAGGRPEDRTDGRVLAFAARVHESTGEEWLPQGAPLGQNRLHGVFTYHLAQALNGHPQPTLHDIERTLRDAYAREKRAEPTPQFKGDPALRLR